MTHILSITNVLLVVNNTKQSPFQTIAYSHLLALIVLIVQKEKMKLVDSDLLTLGATYVR